jgi:UDP-N-acetylmuramate-alanine ligase
MNNLETYQNFYFVGIGGIGMSALARYFHASGKKVLGYDKTNTKLTQQLMKEGIDIVFEDVIDQKSHLTSKRKYIGDLYSCY